MDASKIVDNLLEDEDEMSVKDMLPGVVQNPNSVVYSLDQMKRTNPLFFSKGACQHAGTVKIWKKGNFLILKDVDPHTRVTTFKLWLYHKKGDAWRVRLVDRAVDSLEAAGRLLDQSKNKSILELFPHYQHE